MSREKTLEELEKENKELRAALAQVMQAYEALGDALRACPEISENSSDATAQSTRDVKKLLEKYSRL